MEFDFYALWDDPARDNCAIYIREGAIIPKREVEQYIGELYRHGKVNPITFSIYPGRDNSYKLYLDDDGVSNKADAAKALVDSTDTPGSFYYNNSLNTTYIKIFDMMNDITEDVVF